ncbi:hypothetical protein Taro_047754 [Colocasia esculenta]|uniref:Patatin n=1 Tax=Colocasia esculenta TaxID=4460 RepID=A0A843WWV1_COLES|nr:hypothetical protein [Colocasia esculenta]
MSAAAALMEPSFNMDKLSYEIFSILESKFLFDDPKFLVHATADAAPPVAMPSPRDAPSSSAGRVRVLSVDASGATDGLFAAASLARLECSLRKLSGEPSARIADFFDVAAGSGVGGVLVALLFTRGPAGRPLFSAAEAVEFLARNRRALQPKGKKKSVFSAIFRRSGDTTDRLLRRVLGDATLRDTVKPVLIPCYDLSTGAPFLFSRADAVETDGYDFLLREVCAATVASAKMRSVDGRTTIDAVDGGVAAGNPAAAAITHVLNNRMEFPFVTGVDDLLLVSLGNGESTAACGRQREARRALMSPSRPDIVKIAGEGASDMVDQAVSMAFGPNRTSNYVRIQASVCDSGRFRTVDDAGQLLAKAEELLAQKNVESVLFQGRRVSEKSNGEKLEWVSAELIREHEGRKKCPIPVVVFKQGSPRSSSCSALSSCSGSPMATASPR